MGNPINVVDFAEFDNDEYEVSCSLCWHNYYYSQLHLCSIQPESESSSDSDSDQTIDPQELERIGLEHFDMFEDPAPADPSADSQGEMDMDVDSAVGSDEDAHGEPDEDEPEEEQEESVGDLQVRFFSFLFSLQLIDYFRFNDRTIGHLASSIPLGLWWSIISLLRNPTPPKLCQTPLILCSRTLKCLLKVPPFDGTSARLWMPHFQNLTFRQMWIHAQRWSKISGRNSSLKM
jgi:hypothetical protein